MPLHGMNRQRWEEHIRAATHHIRLAQAAIDSASDVTEDDDVDMRLCFAGNALQGPLALLREASTAHRELELPSVEQAP